MASRLPSFQSTTLADILIADDNRCAQKLLKKKGHLKNSKSTDPIYSQLFVICEEDLKVKTKNSSINHKDIRSEQSHTKLTQKVKKIQSERKPYKRSFVATSFSVELPPIQKKFQPPLLPLTSKKYVKGSNLSMAIQYKSKYSAENRSAVECKDEIRPRVSNSKRYSTLNQEELGKIAHLQFLRKKKQLLRAGNKNLNHLSQWNQIDILKLQTYFIKLKKLKKNTLPSQSKINSLKESSLRNFLPEQAKIPDFIKTYKVTNPQLNVDSLVKMEKFGILFEETISLYFGEVEKGMKNGVGIFLSCSYKYEGVYHEDEKIEGCQITVNGYYKGKFKNNKRHGVGEYFWRNGESYSGQWKDGAKCGTGIWKSGKGDSYIGQWIDGKVEGYGVHISAIGQRYEGQFKQFLKCGKGEQHFPNGDFYKGEYLNGNAHGKGKYIWKNKIIFEGNFENGYRQGKGTITAKNYLKFSGIFKEDLPEGEGFLVLGNGDSYVGMFEKGEKSGEGTLRIKSEQKILSGKWKNNKFVFYE